jgi:hypothetical protein
LPGSVLDTVNFLREAYVPSTLEAATAVAISEAIAGSVSGVLSRETANAIGDTKKDSLNTKIAATTAFFGTRGLLSTAARILGLPKPVAFLASVIIGAVVSELAKAAGRQSDNAIKSLKSEIQVKLNVPEVAGDMTKWIVYDVLYHYDHHGPDMIDQSVMSFSYGATAAMAGVLMNLAVTALQLWYQRLLRTGTGTATQDMAQHDFDADTRPVRVSKTRNTDKLLQSPQLLRLGQASLEGGVMFLSFQTVLSMLAMTVPPKYNYKFAFNSFLEYVQSDLTTRGVS